MLHHQLNQFFEFGKSLLDKMLIWNVEIYQGFLRQINFINVVFILQSDFLLLNRRNFNLASVSHLSIVNFFNLDVSYLLAGLYRFLFFRHNEWFNQKVFGYREHFLSFCNIMNTFKY